MYVQKTFIQKERGREKEKDRDKQEPVFLARST